MICNRADSDEPRFVSSTRQSSRKSWELLLFLSHPVETIVSVPEKEVGQRHQHGVRWVKPMHVGYQTQQQIVQPIIDLIVVLSCRSDNQWIRNPAGLET